MSDKRYPANIISSTAVEPTGSFEDSTASGTWSLQEAFTYVKAGLWPTPGNQKPLIEDVFSTYLYTGNGSSQVIENGINLGQSNAGGAVEFDPFTDWLSVSHSSSLDLVGDFTLECWVYSRQGTWTTTRVLASKGYNQTGGFLWWIVPNSGQVSFRINSDLTIGASTTLNFNQWTHFAVTRSGTTVRVFVNGTQVATNNSSQSLNRVDPLLISRITPISDDGWQDGFISNYRIVNGTALYTSNFTPPTSELTAIAGTVLLTCQGADPFVDNSPNAFTITQNGDPQAATFGPFNAATPGEGGLVWIKERPTAGSHILEDTVRGAGQFLSTNNTNAESGTVGISAFNSNGFSLDNWSGTNSDTKGYVSWTFRKAPRFFDVVTYTGNGTGQTIPHNLGCDVGTVIVKNLTTARNWVVRHRSGGLNDYFNLNNTNGTQTNSVVFGGVAPTSTEFTVGSAVETNTSGEQYVAYLFAHDPLGPSGDGSDGLIACGSYTGTGAAGNFVDLGWEPQWILIKRTDLAQQWPMVDVMRGATADGTIQQLRAQSEFAESTVGGKASPNATGFTLNDGDAEWNASGGTYIYIAIRRGPMRQPTSGTEVFAVSASAGTGTRKVIPTGFPPDFFLGNNRGGGSFAHPVASKLQGNQEFMLTQSTAAATTGGGADAAFSGQSENNTAMVLPDADHNNSGSNFVYYIMGRAPGFFDVVAYTGDGASNRAINHNLGVSPDMIWIKRRDSTSDWTAAVRSSGTVYYWSIDVNSTNGASTFDYTTSMNDSTFNAWIGSSSDETNTSGATYIAYLFATLPGVSKVGSYTGNGSSQTIDCGFTSGARFVLIKRTDSTGDWYVWDSARGIVAGNDPHLSLNTTAAEVTTDDSVDADSSGFIVNQDAATNVNVSSASYIFLAIA